MTTFFIPGIDDLDEAEALYTDVAADLGVQPVPRHHRLASISFTHNGEQWIATVGERMAGQRELPDRSRRSRQGFIPRPPRTQRIDDPATVTAIYDAATCYYVLTDCFEGDGTASHWENPFIMGYHATFEVVRFDG